MKNTLKLFFTTFLLFCFYILKAQDAPTPQDAVDFIKKVGTENPATDYKFDNINLIDGKLYILQLSGYGSYSQIWNLYIINLQKVRLIRGINHTDKIYADNNEDLISFEWITINHESLPSRFFKLKTAEEQYDYFKKKAKGPQLGVDYEIFLPFIRPEESFGKYKDENYYERVIKAFDFLIKYYGGGKVLNDPNSKF